jgi:protein-S-isoprenylcysteine O-methyltransferase Ste14
MASVLRHPYFLLLATFCALWAAARIGLAFRKKHHSPDEEDTEDFTFIVGATLTLLGLIIGFTFSMAVSRYDQRMNFEEQEANAIGTEYIRVDALPPADAAKIRSLLKEYLDNRIQYYVARDQDSLVKINAATLQLQNLLWTAVIAPAKTQPTPLTALAVSGMNDVLNAQGYAQAAWWNRIPAAAWILLVTISVFCNLLIGYGVRLKSELLFLILPVVLSVSLFLIADIDSPRRGVIHIRAQNLESLAESLKAQ